MATDNMSLLACWEPEASCSSCLQTLDNHPEDITIIFGEVERTVLGVSAILFAIVGTIVNAVLLAGLLFAPRWVATEAFVLLRMVLGHHFLLPRGSKIYFSGRFWAIFSYFREHQKHLFQGAAWLPQHSEHDPLHLLRRCLRPPLQSPPPPHTGPAYHTWYWLGGWLMHNHVGKEV